MPKRPSRKTVETLTHGDASRKNIPTAEFRSVMERAEQSPVQVAYQRRNRDLDPQLVWRGKHLYDKPYEDSRKVRVAGPFTVESLSPHRVLAVDENDELLDRAAEPRADYGPQQDFAGMILEQLATGGVQQAHKEDRIAFAAVTPWPGAYISARKDATAKALEIPARRSAPGFSSARSSARCPGRTWWRPRARRATPASTS